MIKIKIDDRLHELGLTMNKLATLSDTRPNTINDLAKGKAQRIDFTTLDKILNALNCLILERNLNRPFYELSDIIEYNFRLSTIHNEADSN